MVVGFLSFVFQSFKGLLSFGLIYLAKGKERSVARSRVVFSLSYFSFPTKPRQNYSNLRHFHGLFVPWKVVEVGFV